MADITKFDEYRQEFTSFSGADIVAVIGKRVVGSCQSVTFSIKREVAPIFTLGSADARSFSRGKRGIAGSLVFTMFDREPLMTALIGDWKDPEILEPYGQIYTAIGNYTSGDQALDRVITGLGITQWNQSMMGGDNEYSGDGHDLFKDIKGFSPTGLLYADQIMPFNINVYMKNEYGAAAVLNLIGCQIINEGMGFSVDDISTEKAYSFVCRTVWPLRPIPTASTAVSG